jgi:hypothetical protein
MAFTFQQMPDYFNRDLMSYDECTNAVVSHNITRDFFPPRLRLNPLDESYAGWKEGPDWQHIPPISFYIPYVFYSIDGHASLEMRRLSYVFIAFLQGLLFLIAVSALFRQKRAIFTAILASWLWLLTPFVRQVLNANAFGYSDIVLSFSVVLSIIGTLCYKYLEFRTPKDKRNFLILVIFGATLPLLVKNVLGALPLAFLFYFLVRERGEENVPKGSILMAVLIPLATCAIYYGACLWKSPEAFKAEFFVSFQHFGNYEGWAKPFWYYLTNYLPYRYLGWMYFPFLIALGYSIYLWRQEEPSQRKVITGTFLVYFLIVFAVISIVTSKSANFLLQGYFFILFFVLYMLIDKLAKSIPGIRFNNLIQWMYSIRLQVFAVSLVVFGTFLYLNLSSIKELRTETFEYVTQKHTFFEFGFLCERYLYADQHFLFILDTDSLQYAGDMVHEDPDYWMRYYILFNSGSEARRLEEVREYDADHDLLTTMRRRYKQIYLVTSKKLLDSKYADHSNKFQALGNYFFMRVKHEEVQGFL